MAPHARRNARRASTDAEPRILPLSSGRPHSVRALVEAAVARHAATNAGVRVSLDAGAGAEIDADPAVIRDLLEPLVAAAFANAGAEAAGTTDGPCLHEVDVMVVGTADAIEVEIADSGPDQPAAARLTTTVRELAARCAADVSHARCASGGTAVTVRFPRLGARRQAA
ncbi:MAG: hypothetical protein ACKO40_13095 [Planctomycetaceae bacterium]